MSDYPDAVARTAPGREAAVLGGRRVSYRELARAIEDCALALLAHGVAKGDRVAILSTPRPEYLVVLLAAMRIGAIAVGLNPVHQLDEYRHVVADCQPRLLFAFSHPRGLDKVPALRSLRGEFGCIEKLIDLADAAATGIGESYGDFLRSGAAVAAASRAAATAAVAPDDVALIVYTSGSTGRPKGALITHGNLARCADIQLQMFPVTPLRALCNLPINHTACSSDVIAYAIAGGGTVVFQERFDPAGTMALIEKERITFLLQITAMFHPILAARSRRAYDTSSLQYVFFLGAPMPRDMVADLMRLGGAVVTGWGLTEATTSVTFTVPGEGLDVLAESVGRPAAPHRLRIVDPSGRTLPTGEVGEVLVRGPGVMAGYYRRPEASAAAIDGDGWLHSGDLGRVDEAGRLTLVGRIKEMFKSGGYNVYPREVELALESHPSVAVAVVVAVPDRLYFEVGVAFVVAKAARRLTEDELAAHCRRRLANYKVPKAFFLRDALPTLSVGKIDKVALRKEATRARDVDEG